MAGNFMLWLMDSFDFHSCSLDSRRRYSPRLLLMYHESERFGSCFAWVGSWIAWSMGFPGGTGGRWIHLGFEALYFDSTICITHSFWSVTCYQLLEQFTAGSWKVTKHKQNKSKLTLRHLRENPGFYVNFHLI